MQMQIHVKGLVRASRLRVVAANKLNVTLARFSRVVLRLKDNSILVVEDLGANMMEVIDRVTDRLHHTVSKQLSRLVKIDRSGIRQGNLVAAMS